MPSSIGALLPRDFLERQPKRWQKSQKKRRVLGTLKKLKAKRDKLETKTMANIQRDAGVPVTRSAPSEDAEPKKAKAKAKAKPPSSTAQAEVDDDEEKRRRRKRRKGRRIKKREW